MTEMHFKPKTSQLGIAGNSYRIQLGVIKAKWTIRLLKGEDVIGFHIFRDTKLEELPETNQIVNWVLNTVPLLISSYYIWTMVQILLYQASKKREKITSSNTQCNKILKTEIDNLENLNKI